MFILILQVDISNNLKRIALANANEPLLQDNPRRFVIFPIQYHVSIGIYYIYFNIVKFIASFLNLIY